MINACVNCGKEVAEGTRVCERCAFLPTLVVETSTHEASEKKEEGGAGKESFSEWKFLRSKEQREWVRYRTQELVRNAHDRTVDSLVFLDRSARPFSWLFKSIWEKKYPEQKCPNIKFINIGSPNHGVHSGFQPFSEEIETLEPSDEMCDKYSEDELDEYIHTPKREFEGKLSAAAMHDEWLSFEMLPKNWQSDIRSRKESIESVRKKYRECTKDRNILVVEEKSVSGASLSLTLGLFHLAFPNTLVRSVTLFKGSGYIPADQHIVPWLQGPGTGLLELSNTGETMLSSGATEKNIRELIKQLEDQLEKKQQEIHVQEGKAVSAVKADTPVFIQRSQELIGGIEAGQTREKLYQDLRRFQEYASLIVEEYTSPKERKNIVDNTMQKLFGFLKERRDLESKIYDATKKSTPYLFTDIVTALSSLSNIYKEINQLKQSLDIWSDTYGVNDSRVQSNSPTRAGYYQLFRHTEGGKQLRREIRALADMDEVTVAAMPDIEVLKMEAKSVRRQGNGVD